jgi:nitrilase
MGNGMVSLCMSVKIAHVSVVIDEHGEIILYRRKLKPSHYERTLFGDSGPESVTNTVETSIGRISVLNCWEHFQPLLK